MLHADETPVKQLDPGKGKTKTAYLWAYRNTPLSGSAPIILFDYQGGRSGQHVRDFLADWQGQLMVDDYGGYKALFKTGVIELGCWAHARRKFFELHQANGSPIAAEALRRIGELYALEAQAKDLNPDQRLALRQKAAQPKLLEFKIWLDETGSKVALNSALAKAIVYSKRCWAALEHYAQSGIVPIDNNPVENSIRPIAIGKNTGYLRAVNGPANAPPQSKRGWAPPMSD